MANEIIRPTQLPARADPVATEVVPSDNGATVGGVTWVDGVNAAVPPASQAEAEAGVINTKRMTPLTTKQAIEAQVPPKISAAIGALNLGTASQAQVEDFATAVQGSKADSAVQPSRSVGTGTGLTGGGNLSADRTISLSAASIASLARADSSVQSVNAIEPGPDGGINILGLLPSGGSASSVLSKSSGNDFDTYWADISDIAIPDGSITDAKIATPADPSQGVDAGKLTFSFEYAPGFTEHRSVAQVIREAPYNLKTMFPVSGDLTGDDRPGIQAALDKCLADRRVLYIPKGGYQVSAAGNNRCLTNQGVSIVTDSAVEAFIQPRSDVANTDTIMLVEFAAGYNHGYWYIERLGIRPSASFSTGIKGGKALHLLMDVVDINPGKIRIQYCDFWPSNGLSLHIENNGTLLPQGCPSNSLISDNMFWGGVKASAIGDSNEFLRNVVRDYANLSQACGFDISVVDHGIGSAGHNVFRGNNIDCRGGAFLIHNGRHMTIDNNNIEHSAGDGTSFGAVIDLRGDLGPVHMPEVTRNHIGIFGTSIAVRAVAIGGGTVTKAFVDRNEFLAGKVVGQGIWNRSGSDGLLAGDNSFGSSGFTTRFLNDGGTNVRSISTASGYTP